MATVKRNLWVLVVGLAVVPAVSAQGYNPYFMTPQQYNLNSLQSPAARALNPWLYGSGINPYTAFPSAVDPAAQLQQQIPFAGNPFNPYTPGGYNPYTAYAPYSSPTGATLAGIAEVYRGYSTVLTSQESARILREQAMQAKVDTARKRFDFQLYVRANTPTFADEQKRIAKNTLQRIQISSLPTEIVNGKSINILLDDIRRFPYKKANMEPLPLSESVLSRINVTGKTQGVGILRDGGKLDWPTALIDILPPEQRQAVDKLTQTLVANASQGRIDRQILDDLSTRMTEVKNLLAKRVGEIPTGKYLEADEFLTEFKDARQGVADGQMDEQLRFQQFVKGGKTMQEVADFMVASGLKFAPATSRDDAAYRALHSAMVAFDIVLNTQTGSETAKETPAPPAPANP